jgi:hypothetical protein
MEIVSFQEAIRLSSTDTVKWKRIVEKLRMEVDNSAVVPQPGILHYTSRSLVR